jgi:hypothetical protein
MGQQGPKRRAKIGWGLWLVFFLFLFIYGGLGFYVGARGYSYLRLVFPGLGGWAYWPVYWLVAGSFFIGFGLKGVLPRRLLLLFSRVGDYWLAVFTYLLLALPLADLLLLWVPSARPLLGLVIALLIVLLLAYGVKNARNPRVSRYRLDIPARNGPEGELRVAMASDLHLGSEVGVDRLDRMVDLIDRLDPELVLLAGDIIERDFETLPPSAVAEAWKRLSPRLGTYAVMGNHDYYSGMAEELVDQLRKAGVIVLRDEVARVGGRVSLVGREEISHAYRNGSQRRPLSELIAEADPGLPVILLDHQPYKLSEAEALGVDLMLAGHTHRGQLFPFNLVTGRVFEVDWGYLRKGGLQVVVSCGYGTWGPPVRIGSYSEVVELDLRFVKGG